jgi:hypothetical protein
MLGLQRLPGDSLSASLRFSFPDFLRSEKVIQGFRSETLADGCFVFELVQGFPELF